MPMAQGVRGRAGTPISESLPGKQAARRHTRRTFHNVNVGVLHTVVAVSYTHLDVYKRQMHKYVTTGICTCYF